MKKKKRKVTWRILWATHKNFKWPFKPIPFIIIFVGVGLAKSCFDIMHFLYQDIYRKILFNN